MKERAVADETALYAMPAASDTAIVVFAAKGGGEGSFRFFKRKKPFPGFSKLLVRDPAEHWYNDGLPGVGDTLGEITARLKTELSELGATRVLTLGSSMGGYAAILFGCMLGAARAIALAPQTLLDQRLRHAPPAKVRPEAPDLRPIVRETPGTAIELMAGWNDFVDVVHAVNLGDLPNVRVLAVRNGQHSFVTDLHQEGRLFPLIAGLIDGATPPICEVNPKPDPDIARQIAEMGLLPADG